MPNEPDNNIIRPNMYNREVAIRSNTPNSLNFSDALETVEALFKLYKNKFFKWDEIYFLIDYDKCYDVSKLGYEQELERHSYTITFNLEGAIQAFMRHIYSEWDPQKYLIIIVKEILQCMEDDIDTKFIYLIFNIDKS